VVVSLSTIEHVGLGFYKDPVRTQGDVTAVQEIWRVLKPRGRFLLTAPYGRPCQSWQRVYDWAGVTNLLSNFQIETMRYYKRFGMAWVEVSREEVADVDSSGETNAVVLVEARRQNQ
jgi:SAM-dependent methyltransferase